MESSLSKINFGLGRLLAAASALAFLGFAQAQSIGPATPAGPKTSAYTTFVAPTLEAPLRLELPAPDEQSISSAKSANSAATLKRLHIGLGQETQGRAEASSAGLKWQAAGASRVAHWEVHSAGAKAIRLGLVAGQLPAGTELRFKGDSDNVVYGPVTAADILEAGAVYWSPVLTGEVATLEVRIPASAPPPALWIASVSHLFASPADPKVEQAAKAAGTCEVNLICRSANDAALARVGTAVARMTFSDAAGSTFLCTGTVLNNSSGSAIPYFATAAHCVNTQQEAASVNTLWFHDSSSCASNFPASNEQNIDGGAALMFADTNGDFSLLRLNKNPPAGVTFAGWDASSIAVGTPVTAVHHPQGDVKKVSLGTVGGFGPSSIANGSFITVNWNSTATGVTEGGSSGSGIFSGSASTDYRYRGGLLGGPSSCTASGSSLSDQYSRFDLAYPSVAQFLTPTTCQYSLSTNSTSVSASGGTGSFSMDTAAGCSWTVSSGASWITVSGGGSGPSDVTFTVQANSGAARTGTVTAGGQTFTIVQATALATTTDNYTALWGNSNEPGWGLNISHQGDIVFSSLFTYDIDGQPMWLYGSNLAKQGDGSFSGPLYRATGPTFDGPWSQNSPTQIGTMTVAFSSVSAGSLSYTVNGALVNKSITRFDFASPVPVCSSTTQSRSTATNYQDLWWNPSESGWGLNIAHQGNIIFASLFTYDDSHRGVWFFASNAPRQADGSFSGTLYRAAGPVFNASPWTPYTPAEVGTFVVRFSAGDSGTLTYSVSGRSVTKPITRFVISASSTVCR